MAVLVLSTRTMATGIVISCIMSRDEAKDGGQSMYGKEVKEDRIAPHGKASRRGVGSHLIGFDADRERVVVGDARSVEVSLLLLHEVMRRARIVQIDGLFSIGGDFGGWTSVKLVCADYLLVGEEEENEELVDDAEIGECGVGRVGVVDVEEEGESICVLLTLSAVVLRWTEAGEGSIEGPDGDASVAVVEERGEIRRDESCCCSGGRSERIGDVWSLTATVILVGRKSGQ